jgi:hypothetical protein
LFIQRHSFNDGRGENFRATKQGLLAEGESLTGEEKQARSTELHGERLDLTMYFARQNHDLPSPS